jgi:anhydro-N-acetylmuramic acid kinase
MRIIGMMSGTSMDGIDAVILETNGETDIKRLYATSLSYPQDFIFALKSLTPETLSEDIIQQSTEMHAKAIEKLLDISGEDKNSIDLIGYHGQTIYHAPAEKISLQVGNPQWLANYFDLPVVFDFRTQDILHGGQGAPLAPLYHHALMLQAKLDELAIVNCGGIANISLLKKNHIQAGFDTGPGNALLDQFVSTWTEKKYLMDADGLFAAAGNIDKAFLQILFEKTTKNYYQKLPPKSLDSKEVLFIKEIMQRFPTHHIQHLYDGCATLAAFTAYTLTTNLPEIPTHWVICGGGAKNPAILNALKHFLPTSVHLQTADNMGWSNTYMEAELIAWLAARHLKGLPLTLPETTGVEKPMTGGRCFYPIQKML